MSVLIPGMEMPKDCDKCLYSAWSNFYQIYVCNAIRKDEPVLFEGKQIKSTAIARSGRADNCPLIPVPPHGDLIDRDALLNNKGVGTQIAGWGKMYHETVIEYAPAIIPASGGKENE